MKLAIPGKSLALLALVTFFWGINWPIMKIAIEEIPMMVFRSLCVGFGALGLFSVAILSNGRVKPSITELKHLIAPAICNVTFWNVLTIIALSLIPAGRGSVLAFTMPVWATLFGVVLLGDRMTPRVGLGLVCGLFGLAVLIGDDLIRLGTAPTGALAMVGAALAWGLGTALIKRKPINLPVSSLTAWQLAIGGLPIIIYALVTWPEPSRPITWVGLTATLYVILIPMTFCMWAWFTILKSSSVAVASVSTMLIPVIGVISSALLLQEQPGWQDFIALFCVVVAIAAVLLPSRAARQPTN